MLPAANRLTRREDFATAIRRGRRAARGSIVVHLFCRADAGGGPMPPRVGFVVGRAVGGSVVRHRVQRRLRHLMRSRLGLLPDGALAAVRALPAAAGASGGVLAHDLDAALDAVRRKVGGSPTQLTSGGRR